MHATRANAKAEADPILDEKFVARFCTEAEEAVVWAFTQWRDQSPFYPSILDINELIKVWKRNRREAEAEQCRRGEQAETERRHAAGDHLLSAEELEEMKSKIARTTEQKTMANTAAPVRKVIEHSQDEWLQLREKQLQLQLDHIRAQRARSVKVTDGTGA